MKSEKKCPEEEQTVKMRGRECAVMVWDTSERRKTCLKVAISMNPPSDPVGPPQKRKFRPQKRETSNVCSVLTETGNWPLSSSPPSVSA